METRLKMRWKEKYQLVLKDGCMTVPSWWRCASNRGSRRSMWHTATTTISTYIRSTVSVIGDAEDKTLRFNCLGRLDWRPLGNKLEFKEKKTGRYHYFGVDEGRWWCSMSCLGVTGKPMVVTVKCGVESDFAIWLLHGPRTMERTLRGSC